MRTFAVIGHGKSPEGKGWGPQIDSCDTVIRMWDSHWQPLKDYGERYDYGLIEIHPMCHARWLKHNQRTPSRGWLATYLTWTSGKYPRMTKSDLPAKSIYIDPAEWQRIGMVELGGVGEKGRLNLTRGAIAACWAIEQAAAGDLILLVGFDNVCNQRTLPLDKAFAQTYLTAEGMAPFDDYKPDAVKVCNHDFGVERRLLETLAARRGVKVEFAQERFKVRTVVVIGHGCSPEGKGWGPKIDGASVVLRMWNWAWQDIKDYGAKYDYGIIEIHPSYTPPFWQHNRVQPAVGWVASDLWNGRLDGINLPKPCHIVNQRIWTTSKEGKAIAGEGETGLWELTRGGIAACWAATNLLAPDSRLILVGMDNVRIGRTLPLTKAFPQAYQNHVTGEGFRGYPKESKAKTGNHDFFAERRLIEALAAKAGATARFAQDVW